MTLPAIFELTLVGVYERGVPNRERLVFQPTQTIDIGQFGILLGVTGSPGMAFPIRDNFFWFGNGVVSSGDWVLVYTCAGKPTGSIIPNTNSKVYTVFWGRPTVIFSDPSIVPVLFRMDAVSVGENQLLLSSQK